MLIVDPVKSERPVVTYRVETTERPPVAIFPKGGTMLGVDERLGADGSIG